MKNERRKFPRTRLEKLTYIRLRGNNGAIILNVSEQGFCFHSFGPVLETGPVHFSFALQGNQLEGVGDLAWVDETRKTGGLHLTEVSAVIRRPSGIGLSRLPDAEFQRACLQKTVPELPIPFGCSIYPGSDVRTESPALSDEFDVRAFSGLTKI